MTADSYHTYTYDAEGNITQRDGGLTTYVYNALNQRVQTAVGSTVTQFVFNTNGQRASIWNGTTRSQLQGQYYWGTKPVAYYASSAAHFQHQDWLGTERLRTTYNHLVEGTFASLPFGDGQTTTGIDGDLYHYAVLDHDSESDTDHGQFRQYSNIQGRWLSPDPYSGSYDPSNPQSFNRYAYGTNLPLSSTDPLGLDGDPCDGSGGPVDAVSPGTFGVRAQDVNPCLPPAASGPPEDPPPPSACNDPATVCVTADPPPPPPELGPYPGPGPIAGGRQGPPQLLNVSAPNSGPPLPCQVQTQTALNNNLNTSAIYQAPTFQLQGQAPGFRGGNYNYNYFLPGVTQAQILQATGGSGRFSGGLHIPQPGGPDPITALYGGGVFGGQNGMFITAHLDSANPLDDLVSLIEHFINDVVLQRGRGGCK